jgi:hypothetical protein
VTTTTEPTGGHLIDEAKKLGAVSMSEERQYEVIINDNGTSSIKYLGFGPIHEAVKVEEEVRATWQRVSAPPIPQYEPPPQDTAPAYRSRASNGSNNKQWCSSVSPEPHSANPEPYCERHNKPLQRSTKSDANGKGWYCPTSV